MEKWTYYFETFGCKVNQYETQALREAWNSLGGRELCQPENADYICINSCAITSRAERDGRNAIYRLRRLAPHAKIIYCGCGAQFFENFKPRKNTNWLAPDICVAQNLKTALLAGPAGPFTARDDKDFAISSYVRGRPVVKIQDGCTQNCTYCIVPQTRGRPRSRAPQDILRECRSLLENGFCEIVISGVNLRQYGRDCPDCGDFWDMLGFLDASLAREFHGRARLRLSSVEPSQLGIKALETIAAARMLCPHLHLSLQHASQPVLKRMGRGHYSAENILNFMERLRSIWPVMGLGADIIAGFPGETVDDVEILLEFMDSLPLSYAHIFPFSARQGTPAKNFTCQIDKKDKLERARILRERVGILKNKFLQQQLGIKNMYIAADSNQRANGIWHGFNEYYAPCLFQTQNSEREGLLQAIPLAVEDGNLMARICGRA